MPFPVKVLDDLTETLSETVPAALSETVPAAGMTVEDLIFKLKQYAFDYCATHKCVSVSIDPHDGAHQVHAGPEKRLVASWYPDD